MPWNGIFEGISATTDSRCFEVISASPTIVTDSASVREEVIPMLKTADEVWGECESFSVVLSPEPQRSVTSLLSSFSGRRLNNVVIVGREVQEDLPADNVIACETANDAAKTLTELAKSEKLIFCFGSVDFAAEIKTEFIKTMNI